MSHIHAIFNHKGQNLLKTEKISLEYSDKNEFTHLYTLHIKPDGTYEVFFDLESKAKGNLVDDWDFPKKSIDDPDDKKPDDWVDETEIDDPADKKPDGYDDIPAQVRPRPLRSRPSAPTTHTRPLAPSLLPTLTLTRLRHCARQIPDPDATKPEDWDDEDDGEWEAPMIDNPDFKGEWFPKKVDNPAYKGEWSPKQIDNKDYEEGVQLASYEKLGHLGFELWIVNNGTIFDNILVTDDIEYAKAQGEKLWKPTKEGEKEVKEKWDKENKPEDDLGEDEEGEGEGDDDEEEPEEEKDEL